MDGSTEKLLPPSGPMRCVLVSACLLGEPCRWHGRRVAPTKATRALMADPDLELVPVCPEVLAGLPTPRPPVKRRKGRVYETCADKTQRKYVTGPDVTAALELGAARTLALARAHGCHEAHLCSWSPSCDATGITGRLLIENGIRVTNAW